MDRPRRTRRPAPTSGSGRAGAPAAPPRPVHRRRRRAGPGRPCRPRAADRRGQGHHGQVLPRRQQVPAVPAAPPTGKARPDVSPWAALADPADLRSWADPRVLLGQGGTAPLSGVLSPPEEWETAGAVPGVPLVDTALRAEAAPDAVRLSPADVPEILALISLTKPGPFLPHTVELGTYLGIRHRSRLIAMAGERLRSPGWTEISAVCTHPRHRGRGLATRLVRAVAAGLRERGETPFLHTAASNTGAIRPYESIGFTLRRRPSFMAVRAPGGPGNTTAKFS
ncbi:GNAT family N-acetyltransferase [Streptomyces sp. NPDC020817]|uniref:GNAT family N-acetyltransferase n=1 Tax=Streptomyces sp. NPDC020817 TaxID=3365095 RepID=UPI00379C8079